eukprot:6999470-Lingulodinium_polyedra.AAC.1
MFGGVCCITAARACSKVMGIDAGILSERFSVFFMTEAVVADILDEVMHHWPNEGCGSTWRK